LPLGRLTLAYNYDVMNDISLPNILNLIMENDNQNSVLVSALEVIYMNLQMDKI
jgi:hypothetical protein